MSPERDGPSPGRRGEAGASYGTVFTVSVLVMLVAVVAIMVSVFPTRFSGDGVGRASDHVFPTIPPFFAVPEAVPEPGAEFQPPRPPFASERPVARETLWERVTARIEAGRLAEARRILATHLRERSGSAGLWAQYGRLLEKAGQKDEALDAYEEAIQLGVGWEVRRDRARLLYQTGATTPALRAYRDLLLARPEAGGLRREYAQLLTTEGKLGAAAGQYRILMASPHGQPADRLSLARVLYWQGQWYKARELASALTGDPRVGDEAAELLERLKADFALPFPEPVTGTTPLERARRAAKLGQFQEANAFYKAALWLGFGTPHVVRREWARLLATQMSEPRRASKVLIPAIAQAPEAARLTLRRDLARYHVWTGALEAARSVLHEMAKAGTARPSDLVLLGDLLRWKGDRAGAFHYYQQALAAEPSLLRAEQGLAQLREARNRRVQRRDPAGVGLEVGGMADSEGFSRWRVLGRSRFPLGGTTRLGVAAGLQRLKGPSLLGTADRSFLGPVVRLGWTEWWRQATLRTHLELGIEELSEQGLSPTVGLNVELPNAAGFGVLAEYSHGPAHPTTLSVSSVELEAVSDATRVSLFRPLGSRWSWWGSLTAGSVRSSRLDHFRYTIESSVERSVTPALNVGYATRLFRYTEPAPLLRGRRAYWSPDLSWSHSLAVELVGPTAPTSGWNYRLRAQPGVAWIREAPGRSTTVQPHLSVRGELEYETEAGRIGAEARYLVGRLGEYESLELSVVGRLRF